MLVFLLNFWEEFLLILYIIGGIFCCSFTHKVTDKKRIFFLLMRTTFAFLIFLIFVNCWQFYGFTLNNIYPLVDGLRLLEFYNITLGDSFGNIFIRKDFLTLFYNLLVNFLTFFYLLLIYDYMRTREAQQKIFLEVPVLVITVLFGLKIFLMASDFMLIVLALELTAFCSIILISLQLQPTSKIALFPFEAAIKYFIFNAVSISMLLFAICGYYSLFKSLNLLTITNAFLFEPAFCYEQIETILFFHLFFFIAFLMKLGAAPFHQWVPDVYEGAELIITAFLVLLIGPILNFKFFIFIKALLPIFELNSFIFGGFIICGIISVLLGSLNAFSQYRIKRFLAYTGITHLGYILLGLGTGTFLGFFASFFYLMFYLLTNCVFFGLLLFSKRVSGLTLIFFNHLKSIGNNNIVLLILFLIPIFSFAGFPPFAGFFSKFFILFALIDLNKIIIAIIILFYIIISAYLYLRFIKVMVFEQTNLTFYLPIPKQNNQQYYRVEQSYTQRDYNNTITNSGTLFIFFFINVILFAFLFLLPTGCLIFQKPLLTLFLFY